MQPTFTKLYTVATQADACEPALTAIQNAANWNELCAHPQINKWAVWLVENVQECDPLCADYAAKLAPLYADYEAKRAPLYADLIAAIRTKYEI